MTRKSCMLAAGIVLTLSWNSYAGAGGVTLNRKADGYRGIWYMCNPVRGKYRYKYSGGLGTYCAKHRPFAIYCEAAGKTFFCYGGTTKTSHRRLLHMVSYYDHEKKVVPRPTILLDKRTSDAHDNPVISMDDDGRVWVFSTAHGTSRPAYIHRSKKPYDVAEFERVEPTRRKDGKPVPMTNFSYAQPWHRPGRGFVCFFTKYGWGADRALGFMTSDDGVRWSAWQKLAAVEKGHYQISFATEAKAASAFNVHPRGRGLDHRTNLYYIETPDRGETWRAADGTKLDLPLAKMENAALVHDYESERLKVYLKDIRFDRAGRPVILFITSKGYRPGPENDPRTWTTARWTGEDWDIRPMTTSDNNYDMGSLFIEADGTWRVIAPTEPGPQPYNPGGEMALWISKNEGRTWKRVRRMTRHSERNHTYARAVRNAQPDFYALWADGHGRKPSRSNLYFCNREGDVYALPRQMTDDHARPKRLRPADAPGH
ncbi:MAG: BNR-4 repeat-containing protein [Planctomycetota bacterium]